MAAGDITDALVSELQIRMGNPEGDKFTKNMCLSALNHAQLKTALFLHPSYLTELETKSSLQTAEGGFTAFNTGFDPPLLNGGAGLLKVGISDTEFVKERLLEDMKKTENIYFAGGATNKIFYKWDGEISFITGAAGQTSYLYYLEQPPTMTTSVDPLLNEHLHDIMLKFAEAILATGDLNINKRSDAYTYAMDQIKRLNDKAFKREPLGIGTSEKRRAMERGENIG